MIQKEEHENNKTDKPDAAVPAFWVLQEQQMCWSNKRRELATPAGLAGIHSGFGLALEIQWLVLNSGWFEINCLCGLK